MLPGWGLRTKRKWKPPTQWLTSMLELKARFTLALIFTTCPTLKREKQEIEPSRGTDGENRGLRYLWGLG